MNICLIDFETTGVITTKDRITEIGAKHCQIVDNKITETPEGEFQRLVFGDGYPELVPRVVLLTGITQEMLNKDGIPFVDMLSQLIGFFHVKGWPDYFVAHNKSFDENMLKNEMKRHKEELVKKIGQEVCERVFDIPWFCTINDLEHPSEFKCKKLSHLCLDYGIRVNPDDLHRATGDLALVVQLLGKAVVNWADTFEASKEPSVIVQAKVPHPRTDDGRGKDKAKEMGFRWQECDGVKVSTAWLKRVKRSQVPELEKLLGHPIVVIQ